MHSCCGQKRAAARSTVTTRSSSESGENNPSVKMAGSQTTHFQYVGGRMLSVVGEATGLRYQFAGHGAVVSVDSRDRLALTRIPWLKEIH